MICYKPFAMKPRNPANESSIQAKIIIGGSRARRLQHGHQQSPNVSREMHASDVSDYPASQQL